jgi:hypothetical protein
MHAARVVAPVEIIRPRLGLHLGRLRRARHVRLSAVHELRLRALTAIRTLDEEHDVSL